MSYLLETSSYTLLAAADLNGFVLEMTELIERKKYSDDPDETRGTIDTERFLLWVRERLCQHLGNALKGEVRSVVVMDNASGQTKKTRDRVRLPP